MSPGDLVRIALLLLFLLGCAEPTARSTGTSAGSPVLTGPSGIAWLVRHAEKVDGSEDSALTIEGEIRALQLARTLSDVPLDRVHSTDTRRTRDTAAPTAGAQRLQVELYDPDLQAVLAEQIRAEGGHHLIVGHSFSVGPMITALGGDRDAVGFSTDYDRLYVVAFPAEGDPVTTALRYGSPAE